MGNVTLDQLRERLKLAETRRDFYVWKSKQPGRLRRYESWAHTYLTHPYLIGAPDERLADRFKHIFMNACELNGEGKITPVMSTEPENFMLKFTHVLEECQLRGTVISSATDAARRPILKYFEKGTPIGVALFSEYDIPSSPILVKYGKREFLEPMFREGRIRLANAALYNDVAHTDAIRDDETSRTFFIPTYKDRLEGRSFVEVRGQRVEFGEDDLVLPLVFEDYYLFSMCEEIHYRMPTDFDADSAIVIKKPAHFKRLLANSFLRHMPEWIPMAGSVTYYDPYLDYKKFRTPELAKHFGYAYQKEHRVAFRARESSPGALEPLFISVGPMNDYSDFLYI